MWPRWAEELREELGKVEGRKAEAVEVDERYLRLDDRLASLAKQLTPIGPQLVRLAERVSAIEVRVADVEPRDAGQACEVSEVSRSLGLLANDVVQTRDTVRGLEAQLGACVAADRIAMGAIAAVEARARQLGEASEEQSRYLASTSETLHARQLVGHKFRPSAASGAGRHGFAAAAAATTTAAAAAIGVGGVPVPRASGVGCAAGAPTAVEAAAVRVALAGGANPSHADYSREHMGGGVGGGSGKTCSGMASAEAMVGAYSGMSMSTGTMSMPWSPTQPQPATGGRAMQLPAVPMAVGVGGLDSAAGLTGTVSGSGSGSGSGSASASASASGTQPHSQGGHTPGGHSHRGVG